MKLSVKSIIYQAIIEDRWIDISYINRENQNTDIISLFECIIKNIPDIENVDGQLSLFEETA